MSTSKNVTTLHLKRKIFFALIGIPSIVIGSGVIVATTVVSISFLGVIFFESIRATFDFFMNIFDKIGKFRGTYASIFEFILKKYNEKYN